jgi:hypothetical protein
MPLTAFQTRRLASLCAAAMLGLTALSFGAGAEPAATPGRTAPRYDASNDLLLPDGFESWVFVGSNLGLAYTTDPRRSEVQTPRFHNVYINPEAYAHFLRTGEFPEPTVLVMEQYVAAEKETHGVLSAGSYNGQRVGLEVAVKNAARPDGVKTPWAYYDFTDRSDPKKAVSHAPAFPDQACESCHRKHASKDNVWVQFYPRLREAIK